MKKISALLLILLFISIQASATEEERICAFLRVKNEINTIEACLTSIDGVFDKIVIIHSNEPDDGTVSFMNNWCAQRTYCEIHEYPYHVVPSHNEQYTTKSVKPENTLAAYYNFGLQFFEPEDWVVKIDADQVYLTERLKKFIQPFKTGIADKTKTYGLTGFNSFIKNHELVLFKHHINGGRDSFFVKRKYIKPFIQTQHYEVSNISAPFATISDPVWFHFMKSLKSGGKVRSNDQASSDEIRYLSQEQKMLFETHIRPLLKNSPYYHATIPTKE